MMIDFQLFWLISEHASLKMPERRRNWDSISGANIRIQSVTLERHLRVGCKCQVHGLDFHLIVMYWLFKHSHKILSKRKYELGKIKSNTKVKFQKFTRDPSFLQTEKTPKPKINMYTKKELDADQA
jgi:hypothetical protein